MRTPPPRKPSAYRHRKISPTPQRTSRAGLSDACFLLLVLAALFAAPAHIFLASPGSVTSSALAPLFSPIYPGVTSWQPPPPLHAPRALQHHPARAQYHGDWARPLAFAAVAIPYGPDSSAAAEGAAVQLFVFTQGVFMHRHGWEMQVVACVVGGHAYMRLWAYSGVYGCRLPKAPVDGEHVSILVANTDGLKRLVNGTTRPRGRATGVVEVGDVMTVAEYEALDHAQMDRVQLQGESLRSRDIDALRVIRSDVLWDPHWDFQVPDATIPARYEVCLMTQEKLFPEDLPDWIGFYHRLGVDMVYLYDNGLPPEATAPYRASETVPPDGASGTNHARGRVQVIDWPWAKSQVQAQNHFLLLARRRCEWALMFDVDEFVLVGDGGPGGWSMETPQSTLKPYLAYRREKGYSEVRFPDILMSGGGYHYRPSEAVPEAYTHVDPYTKGQPGKVAVRTDDALPSSFVHYVQLAGQQKGHRPSSRRDRRRRYQPRAVDLRLSGPVLSPSAAYLVHYRNRSWEDVVRKGRSPRNSIMVPDWNVSRGSANWDVDRPPAWQVAAPRAGTRWTVFRDYWRAVMGASAKSRVGPAGETVTLVVENLGSRCTLTTASVWTRNPAGLPNGPYECARTRRDGFVQENVVYAKDYEV